MKKIININLAGRLIPIEDSAYEILSQYLTSLKKYFSKEEGGDEIVADIEARIAELFHDKLKKGAHCITDEDTLAVKASMGTPEQFDDTASSSSATFTAEEKKAPPQDEFSRRPRKRLYRDPEHKVLSGVCAGLGAYFNIDPVIFRVVFALLAVGGFGTGVLVYFILWVATPAADTAAEKLEMKGERVDLNSIKNTIQDELNQMKGQVKNVGDDIRNFSQGRGKQIGSDLESFFVNLASNLGKVLVSVTKGFFYFFAVVMLICLVVTAFAMVITSAALFPLKDLLLRGTLQNTFIWPAIGLLIGIPIVALLIFVIRKLTGAKESSRYVGYTLSFLWIIGLVLAGIVAISLFKDYRRETSQVSVISIQQPSNGKLILRKAPGGFLANWNEHWRVNFFDNQVLIDDDTTIINRVNISIQKSTDADYHLELKRFAAGRNLQQAQEYLNDIVFSIEQKDSIIYLPEGFSLPRHSKFRNQEVTVLIYVPAGKSLEADREVTRHFDFKRYNREYTDEDDWEDDDDVRGDLKLRMTKDGFKEESEHKAQQEPERKTPKDSSAVKSSPDSSGTENKGYRYKGPSALNVNKTVKTEVGADRLIALLSPALSNILKG